MKALHTTLTTDVLGPPRASVGVRVNCLPVVGDGRAVASFWKPSAEELAMLNAGGLVWLQVLGGTMPPVMLDVLNPAVSADIMPPDTSAEQ